MANPLEQWVREQANLTKPDRIVWCDGSDEEARRLIKVGLTEEKINGKPVLSELNQKNWPNAYFHRSHPSDVARTEHLTFVCHPTKDMAGPNNNWMEPKEAKQKLIPLFDGCMKDRTMYVLPYMMGHPDSPYAKACIQVTDSVYVVLSMRIMTRLTKKVVEKIGSGDHFLKGLHSIGDLSPDRRFIMHFPQENLVWSVGSGYGGNALLGKKCFSLRIASCQGQREGWLAEHMVVMGIEDPQGQVNYVTAAFPSSCGKTNLAMLRSALPGYKIWTIGDDIAWLSVGPDGRLWAINPESGFFGVAPGTSTKTNPNMMATLKDNKFYPTLYTNTAINADTNEPWWEGLEGEMPKNVIDWQGNPYNPAGGGKAAHPNSRFTVSVYNCPVRSPEYDNPKGVPISAIILGGRRASAIPLVAEAETWQQGVFMGARIGSETTAAAAHQVGVVRRDPFAMLPFCGYNMGDYFGHWLNVGRRLSRPPKIYSVNWFRTDENGKFIWPGFGDNIRVLKWILERIQNKVEGRRTPIGILPQLKDLDVSGLNIPKEKLERLFEINPSEWEQEVSDIKKYLTRLGGRVPRAMHEESDTLANRIKTEAASVK